MLPYAAYLRVYEPLSAFPEPDRTRWARYAASADRPQSAEALQAEHDEALRRIIAVPPIVAPARESEHAYVRQADGVTYICPWQTRLRSWLALGRLRATLPPPLAEVFVPRRVAEVVAADFARWHAGGPSMRTYILTTTWQVPLAWFVPFGPPERWLVLGGSHEAGKAVAARPRALIYVTTMAQARRRVTRALGAARGGLSRGAYPQGLEFPAGQAGLPGETRPHPEPGRWTEAGRNAEGGARGEAGRNAERRRRGDVGRGADQRWPGETGGRHADTSGHPGPGTLSGPPAEAVGEIEEVGRWLEEFHPRALVELDYGGLVYLLDDESLQADQSVAEVGAAVTGLETGEFGLAIAMYQRLRARWRLIEAAESAS